MGGATTLHVASALEIAAEGAVLDIRTAARTKSRVSWGDSTSLDAPRRDMRGPDRARSALVASALVRAWSNRLRRAESAGAVGTQAIRFATNNLAPDIERVAATELVAAWSAEARAQTDRAWALGYIVTETWHALVDACPRCWDLDGQTVVRPDRFQDDPPLHPRCMCLIETSVESRMAA